MVTRTADFLGRAQRGLSVLEPLFPDTPPPSRARRAVVILYGIAFFALTTVVLLRQSGVSSTRTIWAEDGPVFYAQALVHPFGQTLTTTYAGYYQLFPRLAMEVARLFPVRDAAGVIALIGAMTVAALALIVFHATRGHIPSSGARCVLVAATILLPLATAELLDNVVNVPWWLFYVTFWMLLWKPLSWPGSILAATICLLATGSDPSVGLFLPLAVVRMAEVRGVRENLVVIGFFGGLLYQLAALLNAGYQSSTAHGTLHELGDLFALRVGLGSFTGTRLTNLIITSRHAAYVAAGIFVIVLVGLAAGFQRDRSVKLLVWVALVFACLTFVVPVWVRGAAPVMTNTTVNFGSRYVAVPVLLVLSAFIVEADGMRWRRGVRHLNVGVLLCLVLLVPCWIVDLRTPNERSVAVSWSTEVLRATSACHRTHAMSESLITSPTGWATPVPCSDLG